MALFWKDSSPAERKFTSEIKKIPMLKPGEDKRLSRAWRDHSDRSARDRLVGSHLRLVESKALHYHKIYGLPAADLMSEGNIGLLTAVDKYDPERGFTLGTYAQWWIKAEMQEYILKNWSLVKMGTTTNQKKLFFNLNQAKAKLQVLGRLADQPRETELVAQVFNVSPGEVLVMEQRLSKDSSLNAPMTFEEDSAERQDFLTDPTPNPAEILLEKDEKAVRRRFLTDALATDLFTPREKDILQQRRLVDDPATLEELGVKYELSKERVRQIEARAFEKLQKEICTRANVAIPPSSKRPKLTTRRASDYENA